MLELPLGVFNARSVRWRLLFETKSGGVGIDGTVSVARTDGGGRWACDVVCDLRGVVETKMARAFIARLNGGATPVLVPNFAADEAPYASGMAPEPVAHSDGSSFSDGSAYLSDGIEVTLEAAALRATRLTVASSVGAALTGGELFSLQPGSVPRLYILHGIDEDTGEWLTSPPLREAIPSGAYVNLDRPKCPMRLMNASEALSALTRPFKAELTLQFQEAF